MAIRYKANERTLSSACYFEKPSMTQQQFLEDCNINKIMAPYLKAGYSVDNIPVVPRGFYLDEDTASLTFEKAQDILLDGIDAFNSLPAYAREEFKNDPIAWLDAQTAALEESRVNEIDAQSSSDNLSQISSTSESSEQSST